MTLLWLLGCTIVLVDEPCSTDAGGSDDTACPVRYADADGDGFGDEATATPRCDEPSGWTATAGDCDDADPDVFPAAPERCNGVSDACDAAWVSDAGLVTRTTDSGWTDLSAAFAAGADDEPAALAYEGGTLDVCEGTWFVRLALTGDVTLRGAGADRTVLDGAGKGAVLTLAGGALRVEGVTVRNGVASEGGGLLVDADATVTVADTTLSGSTATRGGGLLARGAVTLEAVTVSGNTADIGGGLAVADGGTVVVRDSVVTGNTAHVRGGGAAGVEGVVSALSLVDTRVTANTSEESTGGVSAFDLDLACTGSTADGLGVFGNGAADAKPAQISLGGTAATAVGERCDLFDPVLAEDGLIAVPGLDTYAYGLDARFTCSLTGCE